MVSNVVWVLAIVLPILINVAFLTLLERKVLSFSQVRVGPMKVGGFGLLQPFADVVKLFGKGVTLMSMVVTSGFIAAPCLALILALLFMMTLETSESGPSWGFTFLYLLMILSLNIYPLLLAGWTSSSKYALIGGLRGVSQTISYEISLAFLAMALFLELQVTGLGEMSGGFSLVWTFPVLGLWAVSAVAELNRTPFDFSEGESELVSGFNIEYGAVKFAMIFMAEYAMILSLSLFSALLLIPGQSLNLFTVLLGVVLATVIIWLRATYPRYRYDLLMNLAWKSLLPWSLGLVQVTLAILLLS